jgi:hypothetical protein
VTFVDPAYSQDVQECHNTDESDHSSRRRAVAAKIAPSQATSAHALAATTGDGRPWSQHLDLKALRLAVHGWWLGNPLVYKPGVADIGAVARELARAGATSGTLVLSDTPAGGDHPASDDAETKAAALLDAEAASHDSLHAVLILRPPMPGASLGAATAQAVAEVTQAALVRPCAVRWRWHVVLRERGQGSSRLCRVSAEQSEDVAFVDVRLDLRKLWQAALGDTGKPSATLVARSDWREVFLARVLHGLDGRLRALLA